MRRRLLIVAAALLAGSTAGEGRSAETRPAPCLILHDWFGSSPAATPSYVRDHLEFLESQPFDGLALYLRTPDLSLNVTRSVLSDTPLTFEKIAAVLKPVARLPFKTLKHNFAAVLSNNPPDLFDDWTVVVQNFGFLARAAREAGLKGVYFDNENYGVKWGDYPSGVAYPRKSLADYQAQARLRGKQVLQAMTAVFPDITVLTLHGPYVSELKAPSPLFPSWQLSNRLLGPFFAGCVEGAGPKARVVDGGELYHLRKPEDFRQSYEWRKKGIASDRVDCAFLPAALRAQWSGRVEVAFGVYDRPFGGLGMDPAALKPTLTQALLHADRYAWLYVEGPTLLAPPALGGAPAEWVDAIRQGRADALRLAAK
ncbi:MAG TPA: hypothetical protein VNM14_02365 [Planctomycetota bacterium]|jgi:hypothetical protein|nr:hypothetical protein [Planctomycetota bacterium]